MEDFGFGIKRVLLLTLAFFLGAAGCLAILKKNVYLPGLAVGCATFAAYYLLLSFQMHRGASMSRERAVLYLKSGWVSRFSLVIGVGVVSMQFPVIHMGAMLVGYFLPFRFAILLNALSLFPVAFGDEAGLTFKKADATVPPRVA